MKYTEKQTKKAIVDKNDAIIAEVATECALQSFGAFSISEKVKTEAINAAVKDVLKHYKRFDAKKEWAKAIPYINQIARQAASVAVWKSAK